MAQIDCMAVPTPLGPVPWPKIRQSIPHKQPISRPGRPLPCDTICTSKTQPHVCYIEPSIYECHCMPAGPLLIKLMRSTMTSSIKICQSGFDEMSVGILGSFLRTHWQNRRPPKRGTPMKRGPTGSRPAAGRPPGHDKGPQVP